MTKLNLFTAMLVSGVKVSLLTLIAVAPGYAQTLVGGTQVGDQLRFTAGEYNYFRYKDVYRYGFGSTRIEFNQHATLRMKSSGGTPVFQFARNVFLVADLGNVDVVWSGDNDERSYYAYMPAKGLAIVSVTENYELFAVFKAGVMATNYYSHKLLRPGVTTHKGISIHGSIEKKLHVGIDYTRFRDEDLNTWSIGYSLDSGAKLTIGREWGSTQRDRFNVLINWGF